MRTDLRHITTASINATRTDKRYQACIHEASHAIVAHLFKATVKSITIEDKGDAWAGLTTYSYRPCHVQNVFITIAGSVGECLNKRVAGMKMSQTFITKDDRRDLKAYSHTSRVMIRKVVELILHQFWFYVVELAVILYNDGRITGAGFRDFATKTERKCVVKLHLDSVFAVLEHRTAV